MSHQFILSFILAVPIHATLEQTTPAYACGGPPYDYGLTTALEKADTVVYGEILEVDDLHRNGIARVFSYVVGKAGAEYIALKQSEHLHDYAYSVGVDSVSNGCYSSGNAVVSGDSGLLFLNKRDDGSYHLIPASSLISSTFEAKFSVSYWNEDDEFAVLENLSIQDFIDYVIELNEGCA